MTNYLNYKSNGSKVIYHVENNLLNTMIVILRRKKYYTWSASGIHTRTPSIYIDIPLPMNNLFTVNNAQHNYYTRQIDSLHTQVGKNEKVYKLFSFHGINIWNHMSQKIPIDVSYACYKKVYKVIRFHTEWHTYLDYI